MRHALALLAPLLGLGLGMSLSQLAAGATDCKSLGPAEPLTFTPAARARWLAPRVRAPGLLDSLYSTVHRFLSVVQLNPFPSGECAPPQRGPQHLGPQPGFLCPLYHEMCPTYQQALAIFLG